LKIAALKGRTAIDAFLLADAHLDAAFQALEGLTSSDAENAPVREHTVM
jgi:hypothetical protein